MLTHCWWAGYVLGLALPGRSFAVTAVYMLQIVQNVGGNNEDMGLMTGFVAVLELPTMFLFDRLLRRFSCGGLLRFSAVFFAVKTSLVLAANTLAAASAIAGAAVMVLGVREKDKDKVKTGS